MSQNDFGNLESPLSGTVFINEKLEPWRDTLHSMHSGATRPSYAVPGMQWLDTATDPWIIKLFNGTIDAELLYIDNTTGAVSFPDGSAARILVDDSGFVIISGANSQDVFQSIDTYLDNLGALALKDKVAAADFDTTGVAAGKVFVANGSGGGSYLDISALPTGMPFMWSKNAAPPGAMYADGSVLSQTTYAALFAVIGTTYNTGGEGAGNFRIPDDRDQFYRGWYNGGGITPARAFGSLQSHMFQDHVHRFNANVFGSNGGATNVVNLNPGSTNDTIATVSGNFGAETRPMNRAYYPCIKY